MEKTVDVQGNKITFTIIDKKVQNTLFCIHGFDSNRFFIGDLDKKIPNFNVIVISYDKMQQLNIQSVSEVVKYIFQKHLRRKRIFILGHSLGGLFTSEIAHHRKVKGVFLLNPVHPTMWDTKSFSLLSKIVEPNKSKLMESSVNLLIKTLKWKQARIKKFIDPDSKWFNMTSDLVLNGNKIKKRLHNAYKNIQHKTVFLISRTDNIIFADRITKYLQDNNFKYHQLNYDGHSPLSEHSDLIVPYLIDIKSRKRWWFQKHIFK